MQRKWKLLFSSLLATVSPLTAIAAACSPSTTQGQGTTQTNPDTPSTGTDEKAQINVISAATSYEGLGLQANLAKKGARVSELNGAYAPRDYRFDRSLASGSKVSQQEDLTFAQLISNRSLGAPVYQLINEVNALGEVSNTQRVLKPTFTSRQFELADAIVLTMPNGDKQVFDSDEAEVMPEADATATDGSKYYANSVVQATSNNPRSINSTAFQDALQKAKTMSYRIVQGKKWIDKTGNKTEYEIGAKDFWIGFVRTLMQGQNFRITHGGNQDWDKALRDDILFDSANVWWQDNSTFTNAYWYDLFNIDLAALSDESKAVSVDESGRQFFNVSTSGDNTTQFDKIVDATINNYDFVPVPYDYIQAHAEEPIISSVKVNLADDVKNAYKAKIKQATGLAKQSGVYWYGLDLNNTLFAGKYYAEKEYDTNTFTSDVKLNTHYARESFVNNKKNIRLFRTRYQQSKVDPNVYKTTIFNKYTSGEVSAVTYSDLTQSDKNKVDANPKEFGLSYIQGRNTSDLTAVILLTPFPREKTRPGSNANNFEGLVSKFLYNTEADKVLSDHNTIERYFTGPAVELTSALASSINWSRGANDARPEIGLKPWIIGLAQDAKINNNEADRSVENNTPRGNNELLHTFFTYDHKTGQRIALGTPGGNVVTPADSAALSVSAPEGQQYRSAAFNALRTKITALLDDFYATNNVPETEKLDFKLYFRFLNPSDNEINTYKGIVKTWNELDSKGRLNFTIEKAPNDDAWRDYWLGNNIFTLIGWGYDYDGIGSGLDGYTQGAGTLMFFSLLKDRPEIRTKYASAFPQIVKAADAFAAYMEKLTQNPDVIVQFPFEKWHTLETRQLVNFADLLNTYEISESGSLVEVDNDSKLIQKQEGKQYPSLNTISAKFWLEYSENKLEGHPVTKKELLQLATEITLISGVTLKPSLGTLASPFTKQVSSPAYAVPAQNATYFDSSVIQLVEDYNGN